MGVFNGALMLFAVLGYGNMALAGLLERRGEFAVMRCIGMTGKQLREMLLWEGIFYSCCVAGLTLSLGNVILRVTGIAMQRNNSYFVYRFPAAAFLCYAILLLGISIGIPLYSQAAGRYSSRRHV